MFDVRANVVAALNAADTQSAANYDFYSNDYARKNILGGKYPITSFILGVGDLRIIERKHWSHGKNLVRCELDILEYTKFLPDSGGLEGYSLDFALSATLTKAKLNSDETLISELRKSETFTQIHDNIWERIWTLEVLLLEDI